MFQMCPLTPFSFPYHWYPIVTSSQAYLEEDKTMKIRDTFQIKSLISVLVSIFLSLVFSGLTLAAEFSADLIVTPKGEEAMTGKIFVKGNKIRNEMVEDGEKQIMINRPDKNVTWMITPEEKSYMEIPYQETDNNFEEWTADREKQAKELGEETVAGQACRKFEMVEDGEKTIYWVSKKLSFPVKVENSDTTLEYKNIKEGGLSDSLFEIPAGYQKMSMPVPPGGATS